MPQKKKSGTKSKLFRCTGFINCDMVFTRSEHLARHARKHTGEKPFKCVMPDCHRMFSRFDNMMQHTHTHSRTKKKEDCEKTSPSSYSSSTPNTPTNDQTMFIDHHRILPRYDQQEEYHSLYYYSIPPPNQQCTPVYYPSINYHQPLPKDNQPKKIKLNTPIHELADIDTYSIVDRHLSLDEMEALQGFGKFSFKPIVREQCLPSHITTSISTQSRLSKVNAFRQLVSPNESFIRNH